ncbi:MAG: M15 family metallopeptidase [Breznakia sp.]
MKKGKIALVLSMLILFVACFGYMVSNYTDPLARYPYANEENRDMILTYMDDRDIDFIISQKIKPDVFLMFIELEGFQTKNCQFYYNAYMIRENDPSYIVSFVNTYRENFGLLSMELLLKNYTYEALVSFYDETSDKYIEDAKLVLDPSYLLTTITKSRTLWQYEPSSLLAVDTNVFVNSSTIEGQSQVLLQEVVHKPLKALSQALNMKFDKKDGGLVLTSGYVSFADQVKLYNEAVLQYEFNDLQKYIDYPGQSEQQLGYTLKFSIPTVADSTKIAESEQVIWLLEHAYEYGFIIRYPKAYEAETNKQYQPLTLRYVGEKAAKTMQEEKIPLESYEEND